MGEHNEKKRLDGLQGVKDIRSGRVKFVPGQGRNETWLMSQVPAEHQHVAQAVINEFLALTDDGYEDFDGPRVRDLVRQLTELMVKI